MPQRVDGSRVSPQICSGFFSVLRPPVGPGAFIRTCQCHSLGPASAFQRLRARTRLRGQRHKCVCTRHITPFTRCAPAIRVSACHAGRAPRGRPCPAHALHVCPRAAQPSSSPLHHQFCAPLRFTVFRWQISVPTGPDAPRKPEYSDPGSAHKTDRQWAATTDARSPVVPALRGTPSPCSRPPPLPALEVAKVGATAETSSGVR